MHVQGSVHILSWHWAGAVPINDAASRILHWQLPVVRWSTDSSFSIFKEFKKKRKKEQSFKVAKDPMPPLGYKTFLFFLIPKNF